MSAIPIATRLDEFGKPVWIALMILAFVWWWPLGLAILAFMIGSRRMGCWNHNGARRWQKASGNSAFDDYRAGTLRRLEEEQREFKEFLKRLREAKDRAEFDQFMAERRNRPRDESQQQSQP
jgi:biopolymer transport protein ExbB/TolQ